MVEKKKWFIDMLACITLCIYVYSVVCIVVWRGMFGEKKTRNNNNNNI